MSVDDQPRILDKGRASVLDDRSSQLHRPQGMPELFRGDHHQMHSDHNVIRTSTRVSSTKAGTNRGENHS